MYRNSGMVHFPEINKAPSPYSMLQHIGRVETPKLVPRNCLRYLQTTLGMWGGGLVSEFMWGIVVCILVFATARFFHCFVFCILLPCVFEFKKRNSGTGVFQWIFAKFLRASFLLEHLRWLLLEDGVSLRSGAY